MAKQIILNVRVECSKCGNYLQVEDIDYPDEIVLRAEPCGVCADGLSAKEVEKFVKQIADHVRGMGTGLTDEEHYEIMDDIDYLGQNLDCRGASQ